jgi:large subunit ribosomal protein L20
LDHENQRRLQGKRHELFRFMYGLKQSGIDMNRKMLSEMAIHDPTAFTVLCDTAKNAIGA